MKLKAWIGNKYNRHYLVYIFCTLVWYLVNFFRVNGTGGQWAFFNEFIGFSVFLMLVIRYGIKSFCKLIYVGAVGLSALAFYPIFKAFAPQNDYCLQFVGRYINAVLCFLLLIRAFFYFFKEERRERSIKLSVCFVIWALMMIACIASKNQSTWPMWAVVSLGSFYIIPLTKEEKNSLVNGLVDGIIINFFLYQGLALLHCPYNVVHVRYRGFFSNSDCSAKFFTVSYLGFLMKYILLRAQKARKLLRVLTLAFSASMCGFVFFTMTRSGFVGAFFITIVFLFVKAKIFKERWYHICLTGVVLIIIAVSSIPIIFVAIRYMPALRHHPIFNGEYSEALVHSWDPIDSDKYAEWDDVLEMFVWKMHGGDASKFNVHKHISEVRKKYSSDENVNSAETALQDYAEIIELAEDNERVILYSDGVRPGTDEKHPAYLSFSYNSKIEKVLGVRKYIFDYYFRVSGFTGNEEEYVCGELRPGVVFTSAHNSTLDFMSRFGYVAGFLFLIFQIIIPVCGLKQIIKTDNEVDFGIVIAVLCSSLYFSWGLFYSVAFTGEIMDTLFWISAAFVMGKWSQSDKEEWYTYK